MPDGKSGAAGFGSYQITFDTLEAHLESHPQLCGDQLTTADFYLASYVSWGMMWNHIAPRPAFVEFRDRLTARPAYVRTAEWLAAEDEKLKGAQIA